jgi:hypothetical protein
MQRKAPAGFFEFAEEVSRKRLTKPRLARL